MSRLPLPWQATLIGLLAGLLVGVLTSLRKPVSSTDTSVKSAESEELHYIVETRTRMRWRITAKTSPSGTGKPIYEAKEIPSSYRLRVPVMYTSASNIGLPEDKDGFRYSQLALRTYLDRGDLKSAIQFVRELADASKRIEALMVVIDHISEMPLPSSPRSPAPSVISPSSPPKSGMKHARSSTDSRNAMSPDSQKRLREFVTNTRKQIEAVVNAVLELPASESKAYLLLSCSNVQASLADPDGTKQTETASRTIFRNLQERKSEWWEQFKVWVGRTAHWIVGWMVTIGVAAPLILAFVKVICRLLIDLVVSKVGSEDFAKALGTTIRTTATESRLFLPPGSQ